MKIRIDIDEEWEEEEIIIKCRTLDKRIQKIQQAIGNVVKEMPKIAFYKEETQYYIPLDTILFFETWDNKVNAHTKGEIYQIKYRLYELEEILPHFFIRVSKSTIINTNQIFSITNGLTSNHNVEFYHTHKQVYVSRYYFKTLKEKMKERKNDEN